MSEEKRDKEQGEDNTEENTGAGDKPRATSVLDEANEIYKKLEEQNKEFRQLLGRQEEIMAQQMLRGKSNANEEEKPKEETPKEYKERILSNKR